MTYFAIFNEQGFPRGFFTEEEHGDTIPAEAIPITDEQWLEFVLHSGFRVWLDGEVAPYDPPPVEPPFPSVVTAAQAKIALFNAGLLEQVKSVVDAHPYEIVRIWYSDANQWERGNAYVQALGVEIGLTDEEMDDLFIAASKV